MPTKKEYFYALGRRKSATARARLQPGKGVITINNNTPEDYFDNSNQLIEKVKKPLKLLEKENQYDLSIVVAGGGLSGQAEAIRLAIAKSLVVLNEDYKATLKKADLLSRDPREKERKKFGLKGARKKRQFTKR
ncbi:30S ribosomal protein S9 [Candidatus Saccharibacteria bacterium]|nr:30S ribosomal protein S9 [Candidatus Saccharibacteria bacterium]HOR23340.1 30S ribosomal protein S9 [Candidatus Saccharibacteria bacterium]